MDCQLCLTHEEHTAEDCLALSADDLASLARA